MCDLNEVKKPKQPVKRFKKFQVFFSQYLMSFTNSMYNKETHSHEL